MVNTEDKVSKGDASASGMSPRNQAMYWLARREHAQAEIRTKLTARDHAPEVIEATVEGLVADGLLSDARFAESFTAARARRGQGPVRIRAELRQRGVALELIAAQLDAGHDWRQAAADVRQRRFGAEVPADFKEKARQMRFLEYRGFTTTQIRAAVGDSSDDDN